MSSGRRKLLIRVSGMRSTTRHVILFIRYQEILTSFKGLGTSKDSDARDYFSNMGKHVIPFATTQDGDRELIDLAFSKKKADDRKDWLRQFKVSTNDK